MEIDGALVMSNFFSAMGNLFVALGFAALIAMVITSIFIYLVHIKGRDDYGE